MDQQQREITRLQDVKNTLCPFSGVRGINNLCLLQTQFKAPCTHQGRQGAKIATTQELGVFCHDDNVRRQGKSTRHQLAYLFVRPIAGMAEKGEPAF